MKTQQELSKTYEPHDVEDRWISVWLQKNYFAPKLAGGKSDPFCIVIPPPNVTGSLHMGHALNNTLQDVLVRYHRMKGDKTLWVVGTDHAGIATQNVVEKQLASENQTRFDLGREKFIARVWEWKKESGGTIISQLKRLGASCDFANERFTMDDGLSAAVRKVFVQLYQEGLIYRGERLINWCPRCHTALSDLEVEHQEQKGNLWHIKYSIMDSNEFLVVATTRPETMLGDSAVAVHPDDVRYKSVIGKKVILPLLKREIPIIADVTVDQTFGSGVVKITPAHDFNDFTIGRKHKLAEINILTHDGKINEQGGIYKNLTVAEARKKIVEDLENQGLVEKIVEHKNAVGHCYRCKTIVEPYLSKQWFVKTRPLADKAMEAVRQTQTQFVPKHWEKTYFNWMENIEDWCISRQIWWGHQIPAWYCEHAVDSRQSTVDTQCQPIVSSRQPDKCPSCGSTNLSQDPDVLDTWFSSALWPFSTLGWPEKTKILKTFYPTTVLITAFDIIFFWVARMMMMGLHFMKEVPFKHVHIHALVRDPLGQKMSKSKGNVVDPLLMMKKYGTDAFRFTLAAFAAQGRDIKLDEARLAGYRNFCNKIWNASRFALISAAPFITSEKDFAKVKPKHKINRWILTELAKTIKKTEDAINNYQFNVAAHEIYTFFWMDFCDWYLELSKNIYRDGNNDEITETAQTTYHVLDASLRLLHPFMPFITEEIWQMLGERHLTSICVSPFPRDMHGMADYEESWSQIQLLIGTISTIRSIRQETGVPLSQPVDVCLMASADQKKLYTAIEGMVKQLGKVKQITFINAFPSEPSALAKFGDVLVSIPLQGLIDIQKEKDRQSKNLKKLQKDLELLVSKLDDAKFVEHASPELLQEKREQFAAVSDQIQLISRAMERL